MGNSILVTAADGVIGAGIRQCLEESGCVVYCCSINKDVLNPECRYIVPAKDDCYIDNLLEMVADLKPDFLLPVSDPEIRKVSRSRELFESRGVRLIINSEYIIDTFFDKLKTSHWLEEHKLPSIPTFVLGDYAGQLGYPVIIKPRVGWGSKNIFKVSDEKEFARYQQLSSPDSIVQAYIGSPDAEYTTGIFSDGTNVHTISFRREIGPDGSTVKAELVNEEGLEELAKKIAVESGLVGSMNIQSRRVGDEFYAFEINPRLSGTTLIRYNFGFDDANWWLSHLQGGKIEYSPRFSAGVAVRRLTEFYVGMKEK